MLLALSVWAFLWYLIWYPWWITKLVKNGNLFFAEKFEFFVVYVVVCETFLFLMKNWNTKPKNIFHWKNRKFWMKRKFEVKIFSLEKGHALSLFFPTKDFDQLCCINKQKWVKEMGLSGGDTSSWIILWDSGLCIKRDRELWCICERVNLRILW